MAKGKVLVTGCAGFVGGHLCAEMLDEGWDVVGVDNYFSGKRLVAEGLSMRPGFTFVAEDIRTPGLWKRLFAQGPVQAVIHLAAVVSVPYSLAHPKETIEVNRDAALRLFEAAAANGVESVVFAGSAAEYGEASMSAIPEAAATDETVRLSAYGQAKYEASRNVEAMGGCSLRCFNIHGPGQDAASPYSGVVARFTEFALAGKDLTIFGDGAQTRDFVHVSDVVRVYMRAAGLAGEPPLKGIYNVALGKGISVLEAARIIIEVTGSSSGLSFGPPRGGDILHSVADVSRLREVMDTSGFLSFRQGLERTLGLP